MKAVIFIIFLTLLISLQAGSVEAYFIINNNDSNVTNNVTVKTNSNSDNDTSRAEVRVFTQVDGKVIQDVKKSASGNDITVKITNKITGNNDNKKVDSDIKIKQDESDIKKTIKSEIVHFDKVDNNKTKQVSNKNLSNEYFLVLWWQELKKIFINIFSNFK